MACTNKWLADVHAAGGDIEPPLNPEIPAEYLRKPRRGPAPEAYLTFPPPSTCTSFVSPKRRSTALPEIDLPNQKRQRALKAPAHAMSQDSRSPTRKSSRQNKMVDKAQITTSETSGVDDVAVAVEHVSLTTQHVVDLNVTSRSTRRKRAVPPALPTPDLQAWPTPVLTPSVSGTQVDDAGDAEAESTRKSTTSKRSRSPTRRMVDLQIAKKPVFSKMATSSTHVPQDVRILYKAIQALARQSKGVIPLGIENEVKQDADGDLDDHYVAKKKNGKTRKQLNAEFEAMRKIRNETSKCQTKNLHESSWNELVHSRMLEQAELGHPGFSYYNITTARVIKDLVPGNEYGELLKGKMVDYAVTLGPPFIPEAYVINRLATSPSKLQRTINPSDYSPLCYEPVVLGIETKSHNGGSENGKVQLSVWAMAYFNRLRQLMQDPVTITLPLLLITDAHWTLYFASDLANAIHLIDAGDIGTTKDIIGCYTILEALRVIFKWVEDTFVPWFLEGVKPE
ncbi:hypothetical protein GQ44DRAFT_825526 [Phaeosphaeriaceae sp. PMI808]|nr:hypothetical protein GQ44DRAFT_825526 [Phaeosphaeriaceae sp. PMI808]